MRRLRLTMLGIHHYDVFILSSVLLTLTPGQDTFFIMGCSIAHGKKIGVMSALGTIAGCMVHTLTAALGLSALLAASAIAFTVVKLTGAAYLVYLGVRMWMSRSHGQELADASLPSISTATAFRNGMITNLLNPKVALFFLAFMPQFISANSTSKITAFLALGATFLSIGLTWNLVIALCSARLRRFFTENSKAERALNKTAGAIFLFLGLKLAFSK